MKGEGKVTAVLLAAGKGTRLGAGRNKVYLEVAGRPLLAHALAAFTNDLVDRLVLVVAAGEEDAAKGVLASLSREVRLVRGGARRQDSALAGVEAAEEGIVLVHDGARPFPSRDLIVRVLEGARRHGASVPVLPVTETLRYGDEGGFVLPGSVERHGLLEMQTPQGFERDLLLRSLRAGEREFTDEADAVLACGGRVSTVLGEPTNLKVTTREDLLLAAAIARLVRDRRP